MATPFDGSISKTMMKIWWLIPYFGLWHFQENGLNNAYHHFSKPKKK